LSDTTETFSVSKVSIVSTLSSCFFVQPWAKRMQVQGLNVRSGHDVRVRTALIFKPLLRVRVRLYGIGFILVLPRVRV